MTAAVKTMTLDEFLEWSDLPENRGRLFELVRGEAIEMPPPTQRHGGFCARIAELLTAYIRSQKRGYVATNDSGVLLQLQPPTLRGPDVLFYADSPSDEELEASSLRTRTVPTLVVEIFSASDRKSEVAEKVQEYLKAGVSLVWVIHPFEKSVTVSKRGADERILHFGDTLDGNGLLPALSIPVDDLFKKPGH